MNLQKIDERFDLFVAFDEKSQYPSSRVDKVFCYLRIETKCTFTSDTEKEFIQQFNKRTFTQC